MVYRHIGPFFVLTNFLKNSIKGLEIPSIILFLLKCRIKLDGR